MCHSNTLDSSGFGLSLTLDDDADLSLEDDPFRPSETEAWLSGMGQQAESTRRSNKGPAMGRDPRKTLPVEGEQIAPGPGAYCPQPSMVGGELFDSTRPNAPIISVSGRETFGGTVNMKEARNTPGPSSYKVRLRALNHTWAPQSSMHSQDMWAHKASNQKNPGPNHYGDVSAKMNYTKTRAGRFAMPLGLREKDPTYLEDTPEVGFDGKGVGPGAYGRGQGTFGPQYDSKFPTGAKATFSVAARQKPVVGSDPTVTKSGTYKYSGMAAQVDSTKRTQMGKSMSGREWFGTHFKGSGRLSDKEAGGVKSLMAAVRSSASFNRKLHA